MADVIGFWNLDWPNANSQRKYPLHPSATARDMGDTFTLPNDILVSLYLPISADADFDIEKMFLKTLAVYPSSIVVMVGYDTGAAPYPVIATAVIPTSSITEYATYPLAGVGDFDGSVGSIRIGRPASIARLPLGEFNFDRDGGRLDPDCLRPVLPTVDGLVLVNGEDRSAVLTGIIEFIAGNNIRLTPTPVYDGEELIGHQIRIDAIEGEGLSEDCFCDGQQPAGIPIVTINGVSPGLDGNINVSGDSCIGVTSEEGAVALADSCSKPCCGLEAVDVIKDGLTELGSERAALEEFLNRLQSAYDRLAESFAGIRLNDVGCEE